MRTLVVIFLLLAQASHSAPGKPGAPPAGASGDQQGLAAELNAASEAKRVLLSARMYLAIKSVEAYRNGAQSVQLRNSERNTSNFDIEVTPGGKSAWLRPDEKETHFEVVFAPRFLLGEKATIDGPRALGRVAIYAVKKSDLQITRAALEGGMSR
jgi:hypothetical protein